ncbi:MAG: hypothetical protein ACFFCQ_15015, partial [Promethearchaeota archaeon]
ASSLTSTSFSWDISTLVTSTRYLIKVVAQCTEGLISEDISDSTFRIINFSTTSSSSTTDHSTFGFTSISILIAFTIFLIGNRRNQRQ